MKPHLVTRAAPQPAHQLATPLHHAPNAALLIDFDNVTLGVRSDLTKELRTLLNSEIIRGKVAVQRAYADWRRYPQYIVPLSESSIDLIFAPAFGTNKKNATDIRLAVDAVELVFTRPEIGTFILLSGDSDFSSLVLKLKEYGKYVIGVGIKESASDILIQNCDEYYSYSDLAGLTREADAPAVPHDPWELVTAAVTRMVEHHDVMRADRLKQVMQQIDPEFDESKAGYNRFSKFVTEAGARGLIQVIKQDNGQLDVAPVAESARGAAPGASAKPAGTSARGGRRRGGRSAGPAEAASPPPRPAAQTSRPAAARVEGLTLAEAFHLLSRALGELPAPVPHDVLLARMASLHGKEDPLLDLQRFEKLLRQANDAEIADVRQAGEGKYEISPHKADLALQVRADAVPVEPLGATPVVRPPAALRFRGGSRSGARPADLQMVGVIDLNAAAAPAVAAPVTAEIAAADEPATVPGEAEARHGRTRRGKRGGRKHKTVAAVAAPAAPVASAEPVPTGTEKKRSSRRTSKPRAA